MDVDRRGPLSRAIDEGHTDVVTLLIEAGATVRRSHLGSAAEEGHTEVVAQLIEAGLDVNEVSYPLTNAASAGHIETVRFMLEAGADVNHGPRRGGTSVLGAVVGNALGGMVHGNINGRMTASPGYSTYYPEALHSAIRAGHTDVATLLIDAGANVLERNPGRMPRENAVELANRVGQAEMIELLEAATELPMAINVINAAQRGEWERLSRVVARGADVNAPELSNEPRTAGWTALMYAAEAGRVDIVSALLDRGADVNHSGRSSDTALTIAAANGHEAVVELLRAAGAEEG
jgi:ankyrin repeat protein